MTNRPPSTADAALKNGPDPLVDRMLRDVKLSQLRALGLLHRFGTIHAAEGAAAENYNSLKSQLARLNQWFTANVGAPLMTQKSKGVTELTENGLIVAQNLTRLEALLADILEALPSSSITLRIPCTSDCVDDLARFTSNLPPHPGPAVEPLSVPTAEFDPFGLDEPRRPVLSLGSVYRSGPHPPVPAGVEVLTLRDAPIVALSNEDLGLPPQTTLPDVLKSHVKLVIPLGGVVWNFARENAPGIEIGARSRAHLLIHDLNYGLRCLAARTPRRGVMLVHGIEEAILNGSPKYPAFQTPHCYSLIESNDSENRALTALFFNHKAAARRPKNVVAACEAVWQAATTIQSTTQGEDTK